MKTFGKLVFSAAALLAIFASTAHAQTTIRITGSTAFRSAVHNALANILTGAKCAYNGSNLAGANQAVFSGTLNGASYVIETDWTGSLSGINALTNNPTVGTGSGQLSFMAASNITGSTAAPVAGTGLDAENSVPSSGTNANPDGSVPPKFGLYAGPSGGTAVSSPVFESPSSPTYADIALSDADPANTPFAGSGNPLTETTVGVVPFVWVKSAADSGDGDYSTYQNITNVTSEIASNILAQGYLTASDVTGNSADANATIFVSGRDEDSGTRFDTLAEAFNDNVYASINQLEFGGSNTPTGKVSASGTSLQPSSLVLPVPSPASNTGGYNSGGTLAKWLEAQGEDSNLGAYTIAYLSCADAENLVAPVALGVITKSQVPTTYVPGKALTYNGVTVSNAAVSNGTYQFWIFEHYLVRTSGTGSFTSSSPQGTFSAALSSRLLNFDADVAGYLVSSVSATKSKEGALIGAP